MGTFPGARCGWKYGPILTVGPEYRIDFWTRAETSQVLKLNRDRTLDEWAGRHEFSAMKSHLGIKRRWEGRDKPVQFVADANWAIVNWSDVPMPIPDGFHLHWGSCEDNLPP